MKELIMHFQGALILFGIILYFVIAGIIGYFVTDYQNIGLRVFKGIEIGLLIVWAGTVIIFFGFIIISFITFNISKIKAIKRYTYLPLTVEEIKQSIKNGLFSTKESYIKYICDQLRYESLWGFFDCNSIKFTNADLVLMCKSVEEFYKSPIVFTYEEFYEYLKEFKGASPFEFKTEEYNIDSKDIWLDIIAPKHVSIFCTDMSLAKKTIRDTNLECTIYNVEERTLKSYALKKI